jgi:hypothetical protein
MVIAYMNTVQEYVAWRPRALRSPGAVDSYLQTPRSRRRPLRWQGVFIAGVWNT